MVSSHSATTSFRKSQSATTSNTIATVYARLPLSGHLTQLPTNLYSYGLYNYGRCLGTPTQLATNPYSYGLYSYGCCLAFNMTGDEPMITRRRFVRPLAVVALYAAVARFAFTHNYLCADFEAVDRDVSLDMTADASTEVTLKELRWQFEVAPVRRQCIRLEQPALAAGTSRAHFARHAR